MLSEVLSDGDSLALCDWLCEKDSLELSENDVLSLSDNDWLALNHVLFDVEGVSLSDGD